MKNKNMSDIIESYLKQILQQEEHIEISRSEIADHFKCVPSQINYVINTRFTPQKGYIVESKRGGGGYIRIMKLEIVDEADLIDAMVDLIKGKTSLSDATAIIQNLLVNEIVTENEAQIMHSAIDKDALGKIVNADEIRSLILEAMLLKLKYR